MGRSAVQKFKNDRIRVKTEGENAMRYDLKEILELGESGGFAIPAFNVYNTETVMGVMEAAEETGAPLITG